MAAMFSLERPLYAEDPSVNHGLGEAPLHRSDSEAVEPMDLSYIRLDDRLDAAHASQLGARKRVQKEFAQKFLMSWLYHELSLEGAILTADDISRALDGCEGRHYCDGENLKQVRRMRDATRRLKDAARSRDPLRKGTLLEYQAILCGHQSRDPMRQSSGATGAYKHDVIEPEDIDGALRELIARANHDVYQRHPIDVAVDTHYKLIKIWPFEEHSATVARLVSNQILLTHGYPAAVIHAQDRQQYYKALHYDVRRLRSIVMNALIGQVELRERVFKRPPVRPRTRARLAS